jgi:hypothetical protein
VIMTLVQSGLQLGHDHASGAVRSDAVRSGAVRPGRHPVLVAQTVRLDRDALRRLLRTQQGVVARGQAFRCGMTPGALRHRIRAGGPWQRLLPGVYLAVTGTPTLAQMEIAALLYAGPDSVLTGLSALRHHGLRVPDSPRIPVLIPAGGSG